MFYLFTPTSTNQFLHLYFLSCEQSILLVSSFWKSLPRHLFYLSKFLIIFINFNPFSIVQGLNMVFFSQISSFHLDFLRNCRIIELIFELLSKRIFEAFKSTSKIQNHNPFKEFEFLNFRSFLNALDFQHIWSHSKGSKCPFP